MLSKYLIQFSVDGQGCVHSLSFDLRPNCGRGNEDNDDLLQKFPCYTQWPLPCSRPPLTHASTGDSRTLIGKSGSVSCGVTAPFCWVLGVRKVLFVPSKSLFPQSCVSSDGSMVGLTATSSKRAYAISRAAAPKPLPLQQPTADPYLHRRHPNTVLSPSLWGSWVLVRTKFV